MFSGYTDRTVDMFWGIRFNNNREWFAPRKQEFAETVMNPTKELANELYDWFLDQYPELNLNMHISRIYRDARRLFGRGPLKDHIWFSFQNVSDHRSEAPCFWFELGCDGYSYGVGVWMQHAEVAARYRRAIDQNPETLLALDKAYRKQNVFVLEGPEYSKSKGHRGEAIETWYNKKSISLSHSSPYDALSYTHELVQVVKDGYSFLIPYFRFLDSIYHAAD